MSGQSDAGKTLISPKSSPARAYPSAALQRFADGLDTSKNPELQRFNEINKNRVQDFIKKPFVDAPKLHAAAHPVNSPREREGFHNYHTESPAYVAVDSSCPEFQRSLGTRSRFGDGDGSFWDKWVNTEAPSKGLGLDEYGLPVKGQSEAPTSGFKRLYMNRSTSKKTRPLAKTTVEPYSVRREKRLQLEKEEEEARGSRLAADPGGGTEAASRTPLSDFAITSVKADFSSPALQQPLRKSPGKKSSGKGEEWTDVDVYEVGEDGEILFNDAPVALPALTPLEKSSYFGSRARFEFLDIFRQLSRQRYNFKDNKFMTFDDDAEGVVKKSKKDKGFSKPKMKRHGTARFLAVDNLDLASSTASPTDFNANPQPPRAFPRSPVKKPRARSHFQRRMSTEEDPIEVTEAIESDVSNVHLTLPKEGPAKFSRPLSPRHRFILGCINSKATPRPSLLIRKDMSTLLNLEHQNMGDSGGVLLANALDGLPHLCSLNIADNNLTDAGLTAIIKKLPTCPLLSSLDVSENKIDAEAAAELSSYLLSPSCALIDIVMRKSDVDDNEIGSFVQAIGHSKKLINVDLSANLIGSNQRMLKEGLTMGGKVLGEMLCGKGCKIQTLKLAWNMIRFDSGVALMQSLKLNHSLTYLDISYNGLADEGAESLGDALQVNTMLHTILLSNNNISSSGCFCIVEGIKKCVNLSSVDLTNNPIGERGGVSVMTAISTIGDRVKLDLRGCSIARKVATCWYDPENPTGEHTLNLSKHYDRAVAVDMLKECAQSNGRYAVENIRYTPDPKYDTRGMQSMTLTLRKGERFAVEEIKRMPPQLSLDMFDNGAAFLHRLEGACKEVTTSQRKADHHDQFLEVVKTLNLDPDSDTNNLLTLNMTRSALSRLGLGNCDWLCGQIFSTFDPLGVNCIEVDHLKEFFTVQFSHYTDAWKECVHASNGDCYFEFEGKPYLPNNMGTLQLSVRRCGEGSTGKTMTMVQRILTLENINNILSSLKRTDNPYRMCEYALTNASLLFDEAWVMYKFMLNEVGEKNIALSRLLPIMPNHNDARQLINQALRDDILGRVKLRQAMGPLYRVYTGNPTGFYTLHLSKSHDSSCLRHLFDFSRRAKQRRIEDMQLGDTSQHGNGNGFRNAILDGAPLIVTEEWYKTVPAKGKLEFDFVYFLKSPNMQAMSDVRFKKLLETLYLVPIDDPEDIVKLEGEEGADVGSDNEVSPMKENRFKQFFLPPRNLPFNCQMDETDVVDNFMLWCEENKTHRTTVGFPKQMHAPHSVGDGSASASLSVDTSLANLGNIKQRHKTSLTPATPVAVAPAISSRLSRSLSNLSKHGAEVDAEISKDQQAEKVLKYNRARAWTVEYIVEAVGNGPVSCCQLAAIFEELGSADDLTVFNDMMKKPYGTLRVEIFVNLFNQISDPANINCVLHIFTPFDRAALIFRLGILNLWSSVYPDGYYKIDLSRRDERLILRILLTLSAAGSQDEFSEVDFREDPESKAMTAEDLAVAETLHKSWRAEKNIPDEGVVRFNFLSEPNMYNTHRQLPDSLHSEMLSLLYAPPLLLQTEGRVAFTKSGLDISHSLKKTSIAAANAGVKFNFDMSQVRRGKEAAVSQEV